jgi:hypothetical protein
VNIFRSIDTDARPIRFAAVPSDTAVLVRARLDALIAI